MNKDSVRIFNSVVDMFEDLDMKSSTHIGDNDMYFMSLSETDKQHIIATNQDKLKKYYGGWRKRGDELTSKELEKEYGKLE